MHIAIMTDSYYPTRDGVVTSVDTTRHLLEAMGHKVTIIAPDPGDEKQREPGVYYFRAKKFKTYEGYFVPCYPAEPTAVIRKINPDVIHIHGVAFMALDALMASHNTHIPTVLTYVTMVTDVIDQYSPIKLPKEMLVKLASIWLRQLLKRPSAIIVPTPCIGREITGTLCARPKRIAVISTGVDIDHFTRNDGGPAIRARYGIRNKRVLITVGRLSFEKNVDLLIKAMGLMPADTVLMVCGKGPCSQDWQQLAKDTGVDDRVIFAGFVRDDELVSYYSCADAMVSASVFETQGLTVLEAMSCGLPTACGNGRAFIDFVFEGENGYLFNLSPEECAAAMERALHAPDSVRKAARATAEKYSITHTAEQLLALYGEVIKAAGREVHS
ncbi:MAG: glycosyltransferase [Candidatus Methanomethylophilus sp.]|nr:glycosyltransferase [Methanomethylophilus sp.]